MGITDASPRARGRTQRRPRVLALLAACWLVASPLTAHDPGLSALDAVVSSDRVEVELTLAIADWHASSAPRVALRLDGSLVAPHERHVWTDDSGAAHVGLSYRGLHGRELELRSLSLESLPRGHRQLVSVTDQSGVSRRVLLQRDDPIVPLRLDSSTGPDQGVFTSFVSLGIEHILGGSDHLLFLLALLAGIPRLSHALWIVTAFGVAHSLTLVLASVGHLSIPPGVVEPLIAASIVYVGIENLVRFGSIASRQRVMAGFGFGLVHGLGFAGALEEIQLGAEGVNVWALVGFNAGVELGQIAVVGLLLPVFAWLRKRGDVRVLQWSSVMVVLLGLAWLAERTLMTEGLFATLVAM